MQVLKEEGYITQTFQVFHSFVTGMFTDLGTWGINRTQKTTAFSGCQREEKTVAISDLEPLDLRLLLSY